VDPKAGVDDVKKRKFLTLPGLELRTLGRPANSQSLYRLRYPGSPSLRSVLMLSSNPCLCIPSDLFPSGSLTKIIYLVGGPHAPIL
jgi:hypothetical protein